MKDNNLFAYIFDNPDISKYFSHLKSDGAKRMACVWKISWLFHRRWRRGVLFLSVVVFFFVVFAGLINLMDRTHVSSWSGLFIFYYSGIIFHKFDAILEASIKRTYWTKDGRTCTITQTALLYAYISRILERIRAFRKYFAAQLK